VGSDVKQLQATDVNINDVNINPKNPLGRRLQSGAVRVAVNGRCPF
jgi:hypothetical protein